MKLVAVRHAESLGNAANMIDRNNLGAVDKNHLSSVGEQQARDLVQALEQHSIDIAISSPLLRARETLEPYLARHPAPLVIEPLVIERDSGVFAGQRKGAMRDYCLQHSIADRISFRPQDGESIRDVYERAKTFLANAQLAYQGKTVLLCSHVRFLQCLDAAVQGQDVTELTTKVDIPNCSLRVYDL